VGLRSILTIAALGCAAPAKPSFSSSGTRAVMSDGRPECTSDATAEPPQCLPPGTFGRVIFDEPKLPLRVYEHCVQGRVSPSSVLFEVQGSEYDFRAMLELMDPVRARARQAVPGTVSVNLEPCSWDEGRVACIKFETSRGSRADRLRLAPAALQLLLEERGHLGRGRACMPVKITPWPGPLMPAPEPASPPLQR
jgi:hypothetical protein